MYSNFKKTTINYKDSLLLFDTRLYNIFKEIQESHCDLFTDEEIENLIYVNNKKVYNLLEDCIDTEYPVFSERNIKHILVAFKNVEKFGFDEFYLTKEEK